MILYTVDATMVPSYRYNTGKSFTSTATFLELHVLLYDPTTSKISPMHLLLTKRRNDQILFNRENASRIIRNFDISENVDFRKPWLQLNLTKDSPRIRDIPFFFCFIGYSYCGLPACSVSWRQETWAARYERHNATDWLILYSFPVYGTVSILTVDSIP
jgi:hypothetical protein